MRRVLLPFLNHSLDSGKLRPVERCVGHDWGGREQGTQAGRTRAVVVLLHGHQSPAPAATREHRAPPASRPRHPGRLSAHSQPWRILDLSNPSCLYRRCR